MMNSKNSFLTTEIIGKVDCGFERVDCLLSNEPTEDEILLNTSYSDKALLWSKYKRISSLLPSREVDMIELSILHDKDQTSIGKIFSVSQGDVSYRIKRFKKRIEYLISLPEVDPVVMKNDFVELYGKELADMIMLLLFYTSQSKVGDVLGLSQGKVRHRYLTALRIIENAVFDKPHLIIYFDLLVKLKGNYNSMRSLNVQDRWKHKFDSDSSEICIDM